MNAASLQISRIVRPFIAVSLVLWLGGLSCLLGCEMMSPVVARGVETQEASVTGESCPMTAAGHDCCRAAESAGGEAALNVSPLSGGSAMSCCPLVMPSDPARKIRLVIAPGTTVESALLFPPGEPADSNGQQEGRSLRVADRGGTYLRVCVFRI